LSKLPVAYIDLSFFAHATEEETKVVEAASNLLPKSELENINFRRNNLKGHYGNPIVFFVTKIAEKDVVKAVIDIFSSNLSALDKETLLREINLHLEKGSLYLRFDKQAAYLKNFKLGAVDPIRIRIRFKKNRLEEVVQICREIGMLP